MRLSIASFFAFIAAVNTVHAAAWGWPSWGRPKLGQSLPSLQSQSIQASSSAATSPTPPQTPQQQQQITNFQPFNFTVKCRNVSELACQHVHSSLGRVGQKISQQLHITQTINVYLQYEPFSIFDPNSSGAVGYGKFAMEHIL